MKKGIINSSSADATLNGTEDYAWFGWHAACSDSLLLIGAPAADNGTNLSAGKIMGYDFNKLSEPIFILSGNEKFAKLGKSFSTGTPYQDGKEYLAVAEPLKNVLFLTSVGQITLYEMDKLRGSKSTGDITAKAKFTGLQPVGRFGWEAAFKDINADGYDELIAASPWINGLNGSNAGQVYIWNGGKDFPAGILPQLPQGADRSITNSVKQSRFGEAFVFGDFNGDLRADMAFSAPLQSINGRYEGAVYFELTDGPFIQTMTGAEQSRPSSENMQPKDTDSIGSSKTDSSMCFIMSSQK
jgi:hypothetical protein